MPANFTVHIILDLCIREWILLTSLLFMWYWALLLLHVWRLAYEVVTHNGGDSLGLWE